MRLRRDSAHPRPTPGGSSASTVSSSRRSSGAAVEYSASDSAAIRFAVGPAAADQAGPGRQVQPGAGQQVPALGGGDLDEPVGGDRRRPVRRRRRPRGSGSGMPLAISPAAAATSRIRPSRCSSIPVSLVSRLTSRTPSPPLRSSGTGAFAQRFDEHVDLAQQVDDGARGGRVDVGLCGGVPACRVRRGQSDRAGLLAAQHLADQPRQDHRLRSSTLAQQSGGEQPLAPAGPAAVPGAASRVRPTGEPSSSRLSSSRCGLVEAVEQRGDLVGGRVGSLEDRLTRVPGQPGRHLGRPRAATSLAPDQGPVAQIVQRGLQLGRLGPVADQRQPAWRPGHRRRCRRAAPAARRAPRAAGSPARRWRP